jgi:tetratricopeptide (TPR) repeat protein
MTKMFLFSLLAIVLLVSAALGQATDCPEKDYECRLGRLVKTLQDDPKNAETYYNIGLLYQQMGALKAASEAYSMYIAIPGVKPELLADGYNNRGITRRSMRQPELAIEDYTKAIELNPKNARFYVNRGNAAIDLRKPDDALADYQRAISIDPAYALAYASRGHYMLAMNKLDEAIQDLSKAISLDPENAETYYTRALAYRSKGQFSKAISDLDKYIAAGPANPQYLADGLLNRGIAYAEIGKLEQAIEDMTKAIVASPSYADAYGARAHTYRQMKKNDLAAADERKAAELSGRAPAGKSQSAQKTAMDYLAEGSRYYMDGDYQRAIPPYQKALELEKKSRKLDKKFWIVLVDNLGMAYGITGDIKSSFSVFEYGITVEPTYPLFYYNIACGHGELGDEANAIKYLGLAYKHKANMLDGASIPDPMTDSSFEKFRNSQKFTKAVADMKSGK